MKIAGLILVMVFTCGTGKYFSDREKRKLVLCSEICRLLEYLAYSVSSGMKIDDIIRRFSSSDKNGVIKAESKEKLIEYFEKLNFDEKFNKHMLEIRMFVEDLGRLATSEKESERCADMLVNMREIYQKYKDEYEKKNALYVKLGFICGVIICIVLI